MKEKPMDIWTSPTEQRSPFGTHGQAIDNAKNQHYPPLVHTRPLLAHIPTGSITGIFLKPENKKQTKKDFFLNNDNTLFGNIYFEATILMILGPFGNTFH